MTLKDEEDYFEADFSPYEQYRRMLNQEKTQVKNDQAKGTYRYMPQQGFVKFGHREKLVQKIFNIGRRVNQTSLTM
jgi:hypothetical protein